jgi:hypothetical protein
MASPLTDELYRALETRAKELRLIAERDSDNRKAVFAIPSIRKWEGLIREPQNTAIERQKSSFLDEWYSTLQILRDIGQKISDDKNRPIWVPSYVPSGAQADQFLHAHYYNRVFDEQGRSRFAEHFERNKKNPETALLDAIEWWHQLPEPPSNEGRTLLEWAPFLCDKLSEEKLLSLTKLDFEQICQRVWSIQDHARRVANRTLSLPEGHYDMETKTKALATFLFEQRAQNGSNVLEVIYHVLYGGRESDLPLRLWDAVSVAAWKIEHLGISALGELVGWALPNNFPPRNNRTSKSLRSLGFPVTFHA